MPVRMTTTAIPPARRLAAAAFLSLLILPASCSAGAGRSSCDNGRCTVTATGEVNMELKDLDATLRVESIGDDQAAVRVGDQRATIHEGDTSTVGGLSVKLVSASTDKAEFEVTRAGR